MLFVPARIADGLLLVGICKIRRKQNRLLTDAQDFKIARLLKLRRKKYSRYPLGLDNPLRSNLQQSQKGSEAARVRVSFPLKSPPTTHWPPDIAATSR